eukprot:627939-Amphidinium_carterae.1
MHPCLQPCCHFPELSPCFPAVRYALDCWRSHQITCKTIKNRYTRVANNGMVSQPHRTPPDVKSDRPSRGSLRILSWLKVTFKVVNMDVR